MKTMGVLGGLGPQATMDFEARVHKVSQQLIPQVVNSGYPPMFVYYHRAPCFITDEHHKPVYPIQPDPHYIEIVAKLGALVDFLVITSNAPHLLGNIIEEASGRKILSMIDTTLDEVRRHGWRHVGVLGLGDPVVYRERLEKLGVACSILPAEAGGLRDKLDDGIFRVMTGQNGPDDTKTALDAIKRLRAEGVDAIILGCTEIPLLLGDRANDAAFINPLQLLAEAAVKYAME